MHKTDSHQRRLVGKRTYKKKTNSFVMDIWKTLTHVLAEPQEEKLEESMTNEPLEYEEDLDDTE